MTPDDALRYPVGRFAHDGPVTPSDVRRWTDEIAALPDQLRAAVAGLSEADLDTPYRPGGWTVRQVVHHVPDSHLNAYTRIKLALTEERPTIRPYDEVAWAELPDVQAVPVAVSLDLLDALHRRWVALLRALPEAAWERPLVHPVDGPTTVGRAVGSYAWHGRHHLAHVRLVADR